MFLLLLLLFLLRIHDVFLWRPFNLFILFMFFDIFFWIFNKILIFIVILFFILIADFIFFIFIIYVAQNFDIFFVPASFEWKPLRNIIIHVQNLKCFAIFIFQFKF